LLKTHDLNIKFAVQINTVLSFEDFLVVQIRWFLFPKTFSELFYL